MTGQSHFCSKTPGFSRLQEFLELPAFSPVQTLILDSCGFSLVPSFDHLKELERIDLSNNIITALPSRTLRHDNLRKMILDGNPIVTVDFDPQNFPKLEVLSVGSKETQIIGGRLIERSVKAENFSLQVHPKYRSYLTVPLLSHHYTRQTNFQAFGATISEEAAQAPTPDSPRSDSVFLPSTQAVPSSHALHRSSSMRTVLSNPDLPAGVPKRRSSVQESASRPTQSELPHSLRRQTDRSLRLRESPLRRTASVMSNLPQVKESIALDLCQYYKQVKEKLDHSAIRNVQDRYKACVYVLEHVNVSKWLHKLVLSNQGDFCAQCYFETFLQHEKLKFIHVLHLNSCNLTEVPDLTMLQELRHVNLADNHISSVAEWVTKLKMLSVLNLDGNERFRDIGTHIKSCMELELLSVKDTGVEKMHINFKKGELPKLRRLVCGSKHLKFISHATLDAVVNLVASRTIVLLLEVSDYTMSLVVPSHATLCNLTKLGVFLTTDVLADLVNDTASDSDFYKALEFLLEQSEEIFVSLDFKGDKPRKFDVDQMQYVLNHRNAVSLTSLNLGWLNLKEPPDLSNLPKLRELDLEQNSMGSFATLASPSLEILKLSANFCEVLDLDLEKLPRLREVVFGPCKFVSCPVLQRAATGQLKLIVDERFVDRLLVPPPKILANNRAIKRFLKSREMSLNKVNRANVDPVELYKAVIWMLENFPVTYETLNLKNESIFCETLGVEALLDQMPQLKKLVLTNCKLSQVPVVEGCHQLQILNLKQNSIGSLSSVCSDFVVEIDLEDNPIQGVDAVEVNLPALKKLRLGSPHTKFISIATLERMRSGSLVLDIPKKYLKNILFPTPDCFEHPEALSRFIKNAELNLAVIEKNEDKREGAEWVLHHSSPALKSLVLSDGRVAEDWCRDADLAAVLETLNHHMVDLQQLMRLSMPNTGLETFPDVSILRSLTHLNLSRNQIRSVDNTAHSGTLTQLDVSLNPIECLNTDLPQFPSLRKFSLGSPHLKRLCHPFLIRITNRSKSALALQLDSSSKDSLLFPPFAVVANKNLLRKFVEKKELSLHRVPDDQKVETFLWATEKSGAEFRALLLQGEETPLLADERVRGSIFQPAPCFKSLKRIYLSGCGLVATPDLTSMSCLEHIDLSRNQIQNIDETKLPDCVQNLDVQLNPVQAFNSSFSCLSSLCSLHLASPETKYLCYPLLQRVLKLNAFWIDETSAKSLLYPSHTTAIDKEKLQKFVKRRKFALSGVPDDEKVATVVWLTEKCGAQFKRLDLSGEGNLLSIGALKWKKFFKPIWCFEELKEIFMSNCDLTTFPDLSKMSTLKTIDLSHNKLTHLAESCLPKSLQTLFFHGNPVESFDSDLSNYVSHKIHVSIGSPDTRFISTPLMKMVRSGTLHLGVPEEFRPYLWLPHRVVFDSPAEHLSKYIEHPERFLIHIPGIEDGIRAFQWLFTASNTNFSCIDFTKQRWLFDHNVDLSCVRLKRVQTLVLSECNLEKLPKFQEVKHLKHLDLSCNRFTQVPTETDLSGLETLNLENNLMEELDFEPDQFPKLSQLVFGSLSCKYISTPVLKKCLTRNFQLFVPEMSRVSLLLPTWEILQSKSQLEQFISDTTISCDHIEDNAERWAAIQWQLEKAEKQFTAVDFSQSAGLCEFLDEENLAWIFMHPSAAHVTDINLAYCGLSSLPDWSELTELTSVDLNGNSLRTTPPSQSLQLLNIVENCIEVLELPADRFPKLQTITAGSESLSFICFALLGEISAGSVSLEIHCHQNSLVFPPAWVLDSANDLNRCLEEPEKYLDLGDRERFEQAFEWLLRKSDANFTKLDFSGLCERFDDFQFPCEHLVGGNVVNTLTDLNLTCCSLGRIPDEISKLVMLTELTLRENSLPDLSSLQHTGLQFLDVSQNPIPRIDVDFEKCPNLAKLTAGSDRTTAVSSKILCRFRDGLLELDMRHREAILFPPPHIIRHAHKVADYLENGTFHVSWFSKRGEAELSTTDVIYEALSADERTILKFAMNNQPSLVQDRTSLSRILTHPKLNEVECLSLRHCGLTQVPSLRRLKLTYVDLSENNLAETIKDVCRALPNITTLKVRGCGLGELPVFGIQQKLTYLDVGCNDLKSLSTEYTTESLKRLVIDGNPMEDVTFDSARFPNLKKIEFGSEVTKFLGFELLRRTLAVDDGFVSLDDDMMSELSERRESVQSCEEVEQLRNPDDYGAEENLEAAESQESLQSFQGHEEEEQLQGSDESEDSPDFAESYEILQGREDDVHSQSSDESGVEDFADSPESLEGPETARRPDSLKLGNTQGSEHHHTRQSPDSPVSPEDFFHSLEGSTFPLHTKIVYVPPTHGDDSRNDAISATGEESEEDADLSGGSEYESPATEESEKFLDAPDEEGASDDYAEQNDLAESSSEDEAPVVDFEQTPEVQDECPDSHPDPDSERGESVGDEAVDEQDSSDFDLTEDDASSDSGSPAPLRLSLKPKFQSHLLLPPRRMLDKPEQKYDVLLRRYLRTPEKYLKYIRDLPKREEALRWLLENFDSFSSFDLTGQEHLFYHMKFDRVNDMLRQDSLRKITSLDLSNCGLRLCPELQHLTKLQALNLRGNTIEDLEEVEKCSSLRHLDLVGNPMEAIFSETELFENLEELKIGSQPTNEHVKHTKYISHQVLQRWRDGKLSLTVDPDCKEYLVCPSGSVLDDVKKVDNYLRYPESALTKDLSDAEKLGVLEWIVCGSQCDLKKLNLSGHRELFAEITSERTEQCLKVSKLEKLALRDCSLGQTQIEFLNELSLLQELDVSNNNIEVFPVLKLEKLRKLEVQENPMETIDVVVRVAAQENEADAAMTNLPSLKTIVCGSQRTKFVSFPILKLVSEGKLTLQVLGEYQDKLVFPTHTILTDKRALKEFLRNPERELDKFPEEERVKQLLLILQFKQDPESFDLSKHVYGSFENLEFILKQARLLGMKTLALNSCVLSTLPDLTKFAKLEELQINDNMLNTIDFETLPTNLKRLSVVNNPWKVVNYDPSKFPQLQKITCGSQTTRYISFHLLEKVRQNELHIDCDETYKARLIMPTFDVLKNPIQLGEYVVRPDLHVCRVAAQTGPDIHDAIDWMLSDEQGRTFYTDFSLSGIEHPEMLDFQVFKQKSLKSVKNLSLANCSLENVPELDSLSMLQTLDLQNNHLDSLSTQRFDNVTKLWLTGNPIDLDVEFSLKQSFPSLKVLKFGSGKTRYIRLCLLRDLVLKESFEQLIAEGEDRKAMVFPPPDCLQGTEENLEALREICRSPERAVQGHKSVETKAIVLEWLFKQTKLKSFELQNEKELLQHEFKTDDQSPPVTLLHHPKLAQIESLTLRECGLTSLPGIEQLQTLKTLDVSRNFITAWSTWEEHKTLEKLDMSGNELPEICGDLSCFPALREIVVGSKKTEYISMELMERAVNRENKFTHKIVIKLDEDSGSKSTLKMPPAAVLEDPEVCLVSYVTNPEKFVPMLDNAEDQITALKWLVTSNARKSLDLSAQPKLLEGLKKLGLQNVLTPNLSSLKTLNLSKCELREVPNLAGFTKLERLTLSENLLEALPPEHLPYELEFLFVQGNPIETLDISSLPSVKKLTCGSSRSWSILAPTLSMMSFSDLSIIVPPEFRETLEKPPFKILESGPQYVQTYLDRGELDLREISNPSEGLSFYHAQVKEAKIPMKTIELSEVQCVLELAEQDDFQRLLRHEKLREIVETLNLKNCQIQTFPSVLVDMLPNLKQIDLSSNSIPDLEKLPSTVTSLVVRNCGLSALPKCPNLDTLDASENKIDSLDINFCFAKLKTLEVQQNPLTTLDFDPDKFPELGRIRAGHDAMQFISRRVLLWKTKKRTTITIDHHDLQLPPRRLFESSDYDGYLKCPEYYLREVTSDLLEALHWLLDDLPVDTHELNLAGQKNIFNLLHAGGIHDLLQNKTLQNLKKLSLSDVGLRRTPDVSPLRNLEEIDLSKNQIRQLHGGFKNSNVKSLIVTGNPIPELHFDQKNLPSLGRVAFGSQETEKVSLEILQAVVDGIVEPVVPEPYRGYLKFPQYHVLTGDKERLQMYVRTGELDFSDLDQDLVTFDFVKSAIENQGRRLKRLNLSNHPQLFTNTNAKMLSLFITILDLQELRLENCGLSDLMYLKNLQQLEQLFVRNNSLGDVYWLNAKLAHPDLISLDVSFCNVYWIPSLSTLPNLRHLNVRGNQLTNDRHNTLTEALTEGHPLETLDLTENPIELVEVNVSVSFTSLRELRCGSPDTKLIKFDLVRLNAQPAPLSSKASPQTESECLEKKFKPVLAIEVPEEYRNCLIFPPAEFLNDPDALADLLNSSTLEPRKSWDVPRRFRLCNNMLERSTKYRELVLSGQGDFCSSPEHPISSFLRHPNLFDIVSLSLDSCGLKSIPVDASYLPNLKELDVSQNRLTQICGSFYWHKKLEKLWVNGNPVETISIQKFRKNFPRLNYIQAGSQHTKSIDASLLEEVIKKTLTIIVVKEHGGVLVYPPYDILKDGAAAVEGYLKQLSKYKKSTNISTANNVLMFLGPAKAGKTSLKRTLMDNETRETRNKDRTVLLDKDTIELGGNISISSLDFGGQEIYELEYPLFLRGQNIIALVVVDMSKYTAEKHEDLVTKWLRNCVLCAQCEVIIVASKKDKVPQQSWKASVEQIRILVQKWLNEEIDFLKGAKQNIELARKERGEHMIGLNDSSEIDRSLHFFDNFQIRIIPTSTRDVAELAGLRKAITDLIVDTTLEIPKIWSVVFQFIREIHADAKYKLNYSDLRKFVEHEMKDNAVKAFFKSPLPDEKQKQKDERLVDNIDRCLRYLSLKTMILWYDHDSYIKQHIFSNTDNILELHKKLFRHDLESAMEFNQDVHRRFIRSEWEFDLDKRIFLSSGLMSKELLQCQWSDVDGNDFQSMIDLLIANDLCFEDDRVETGSRETSFRKRLRFPWFVNTPHPPDSLWKEDWPATVPQGEVELRYVYTFSKRLPSTLYERISVRLQRIVKRTDNRIDWVNGVFVQKGRVKLLLQRLEKPGKNPLLTVSVRTPMNDTSDLVCLWELCLDSYHKVVDSLVEPIIVVTYHKAFVCPHCILANRSDQEAHRLPLDFVMDPENKCEENPTTLCPKPVSKVSKGLKQETIPAAFLHPLTKGKTDDFSVTANWWVHRKVDHMTLSSSRKFLMSPTC